MSLFHLILLTKGMIKAYETCWKSLSEYRVVLNVYVQHVTPSPNNKGWNDYAMVKFWNVFLTGSYW